MIEFKITGKVKDQGKLKRAIETIVSAIELAQKVNAPLYSHSVNDSEMKLNATFKHKEQ